MSLLFSTDFESGATLASLGFGGAIDAGAVSINNTSGKGYLSTYAMATGSSGVILQALRGDGNGSTEGRAVFDFHFDTGFTTLGPQRIFDFVIVNNKVVSLWLDSSWNILIRDGSAGAGDGATVATISGVASIGTWVHFDVRFKQGLGSTGSCTVLINGAVVYQNDGGYSSDGISPWTGTRYQFYNDMRVDNLFVYDTYSVAGGLGSEATFVNGPQPDVELQIGLTWMIVTTRSGTQYVWSDRPLPDPSTYYLGWKAPRVMQWGAIRRALSDFLTGQYETTDFKVTLTDTDRLLRQLDADAQLVNATIAVYMISDKGRRALETAKTVYRGVIRDAAPQGTLKYDLTIKDTFAEQFSSAIDTNLIPHRLVTTDDFPNCGQTQVASSAEGYLVNGAVAAGEADVPVKTGWGVFAEGDHVTFGAGTDIYTVVSMSSQFVAAGLDAETYISVDPVLIGGLSDNDAIHVRPIHDVTPAVGKRVPIVYGLITDRVIVSGDDTGDGQGPLLYVGDRVLADGKTYGEFLIAGHACYSPSDQPIQQLYFWNEAVDNYGNGIYFPDIGTLATEAGAGGRIAIPGYANWTTTNGIATNYRDFNGRRYTVVYLRGIFKNWALGLTPAPVNLGGVPFAANYYGCEDVGDSSGALITNGLQQYKHTVINWCPPKGLGYQSGAWLSPPTFPDDPTLPMIDEASFDVADAQSGVYVTDGYRGDFIIGADNEALSARDLIARFNLSFGVECGFNRKTQFFVSMINTNLGTTTLQPTLGYVRDIFSGTFAIVPVTRELYTALEYRHTQDFFKRVTEGWRSVLSGVTKVENTSATTAYGSKTTYQQLTLWMVRGNNRSSDPTEYTRGTDTAAAVLALKLARLSAIQHLPALKTGPAGFNYELGDVVPITHYEGLSNAGWTDRPVRIERTETDPSEFVEEIECYDLDPVL